MKKPQSTPIFDDSDFPISIIRKSIFQGTGVDLDEGRAKPIIGIANSLTEINPGHMHLGPIAQQVKEGAHAAGGPNAWEIRFKPTMKGGVDLKCCSDLLDRLATGTSAARGAVLE